MAKKRRSYKVNSTDYNIAGGGGGVGNGGGGVAGGGDEPSPAQPRTDAGRTRSPRIRLCA